LHIFSEAKVCTSRSDSVTPASTTTLSYDIFKRPKLGFTPPLTVHRGLARHEVPGFRLARIATDLRWQGQGLGGQLLAAAARRCLRAAAEVGGVVLIIDAKNDRAARWYTNYGAVPLSNKPLTLVMSLATFAADLKAAGQL
jgi:GNAT superfamily N-acetyltransferase